MGEVHRGGQAGWPRLGRPDTRAGLGWGRGLGEWPERTASNGVAVQLPGCQRAFLVR